MLKQYIQFDYFMNNLIYNKILLKIIDLDFKKLQVWECHSISVEL